MKPKQRAIKIMSKLMPFVRDYDIEKYAKLNAKECALICVDVILNDVGAKDWDDDEATKNNYWQQVKTEIENL